MKFLWIGDVKSSFLLFHVPHILAYMYHIHTKLKFACKFSNHIRACNIITIVPKWKLTRLMHRIARV